jgi:hypothetical protein
MGGGYEQEELIGLVFYLFLIVTEPKVIVLSRDEGLQVVTTTRGLFGILKYVAVDYSLNTRGGS